MDEKHINEIYSAVTHDMKSGNVRWEELIGTGFRYVTAIRAAISAHSAFLDALNKIALFANQSKGGCEDLGKLLCRLVDEEKNIDMMKASAVTHLNDGVLAPLEERVAEWRKMAERSSEHTPKRSNLSESMKSLRKGSSSENLFNRAAMTLSRRSRRGSSSRDRSAKDIQTHEIDIDNKIVTKESLTSVLVENRARITTFVRSLHPYYGSEIEQGRRSAQLTSESKNLQALSHIKTNQISSWLDEQLNLYRDQPDHVNQITRHNRKSSVSSVNSISSSKSDSCSSGSMRLTEPPIFEQNGLRHSLLKIPTDVAQYRLSSTSHDSGFTSHAHETEHLQSAPHIHNEQEFSRNRTPSWKDWPKPGPYDSNRSCSTILAGNEDSKFELPPPPPELLNEGFNEAVTQKLEISTSNEYMSPMQSPDRSSQSTSSLASVPLSPYMKQKPSPLAGPFLDDYSPISRVHAGRAIENGLATIRRKPSQNPLRRTNGSISTPIPTAPRLPTPAGNNNCNFSNPTEGNNLISSGRPPLPSKPKRQGSVLSNEYTH